MCQLCHPDATGTNATGGTAITDRMRPVDGSVNVEARWSDYCWDCH